MLPSGIWNFYVRAFGTLLAENIFFFIFIVAFQTIISTIIILVTAEFLPKVIFRIHANRFLKLLALPLIFFFYLLYPLVLFSSLPKVFMTLIGFKLKELARCTAK